MDEYPVTNAEFKKTSLNDSMSVDRLNTRSCLHYATEILFAAAPVSTLPTTA
jgi:hypothetical protein